MSELQALAAALAIEHEVVFGYGVLGARLDKQRRRFAVTALEAHLARRDQLESLIRSRGSTPAPAAPAYVTPHLSGEQATIVFAAKLEDGCAGAAWDLVASSPAGGSVRTLAVGWLSDAATRAAHWRGSTEPGPVLPGKPG